jgi:hypothetical protein
MWAVAAGSSSIQEAFIRAVSMGAACIKRRWLPECWPQPSQAGLRHDDTGWKVKGESPPVFHLTNQTPVRERTHLHRKSAGICLSRTCRAISVPA